MLGIPLHLPIERSREDTSKIVHALLKKTNLEHITIYLPVIS